MDESAEERWCVERGMEVAACVQRLAVAHGRIGERPAWFAMPYASVWAIESAHRPEWIGWWVIAGDLPTDAIAASGLPAPRDAMRAFGKRWTSQAASLDRGEVPTAWSHVPEGDLPKLAARLRKRGVLLEAWADDPTAWPEEGDAESAG